MTKFMTVPVKSIRTSPTNPRKKPINPDEDSIRELAESIKTNGLINPILVRKVKSKKHAYELISGERRFVACQVAGIADIDIHVEELTDQQALEMQIVENLQRENVHPIDESDVFQAMIDGGRTAQEIAERIGKHVSFVHNRLMLQKLIPEARELLVADKISIMHAKMICRLNVRDQHVALKHTVIRDPDTREVIDTVRVGKLHQFIQSNIENDLAGSVFDKHNASETPYEGKCIACVQCPNRTGYNDTLFHDIQDRDRCLDRKCFAFKTEAHLKSLETELSKKHKVVRISEEMFIGNRDGFRSMYDKQVHIRKEPTGTIGIIWTVGRNTGQTLNIVITGNNAIDSEANEQEDGRNYFSEQAESIQATVASIMHKSPVITIDHMKLTAFALYNQVETISQKRLAKTFGWKLERDGQHMSFDGTNSREYFEHNFDAMDPARKSEFIFLATLNAVAFDPYPAITEWVEQLHKQIEQ